MVVAAAATAPQTTAALGSFLACETCELGQSVAHAATKLRNRYRAVGVS